EQVKIPTGEQPARIGRYFIDLARAQALHGDHTQALDALHQAHAIAPQLVRYHPQAHETVAFLAETQRRDPDSLAGFARWISPHV
ncbi:MAG: helix-turn-helix domain-containing protein, partial [Stackebrandtia sp.]